MVGMSIKNNNVFDPLKKHALRDAFFYCGQYKLPLNRPWIMGIVNVTPDSFSGDGLADRTDRAVEQVNAMIAAGADIIDIGAESTRPGADYCSAEQEIDRILPLLEKIRTLGKPVSIDTNKTVVMKAVIEAGASMINDIRALADEGAMDLLAQHDLIGICLMHMQNNPATMQQDPVYQDVSAEVLNFLLDRAKNCVQAGIDKSRICLDPGFGFGKTAAHNITLFHDIERFCQTGYPVLIGVSRKRFLGEITGLPVTERASVSAAAAMLAVSKGAHIVRVHDVKETGHMLQLLEALG